MKSLAPLNRNFLEKTFDSWSIDVPVERAVTLPSNFYTSRDIFELERHAIFGQNWIYAGRKSQFEKIGDFITDRFLSEPFFINVDSNGILRAQANVCCHHGMRLLSENEGQLTNNEIVCPYHGWTYDSTGRLKKALKLKNIEDFKASKIRLKPISLRTIGPFVYLNWNFLGKENLSAEDSSHIEQIDEKYLRSTNYDELKFVTRRTYSIKCNWKVFVDNYLDGGYHVPIAHRNLTTTLNLNEYQIVVDHPKNSVQFCTGKGRAEGSVVFAFIYPNLMINRYGPFMDTNIVVPIDERNCLVHMDYFYCPKTTSQIDEEKSRVDSHRVQQEDIELCEQVQLGLESQAYDTGRYAPTIEYPMHRFHQTFYNEIRSFYEQK